jgi:hypothetical protein
MRSHILHVETDENVPVSVVERSCNLREDCLSRPGCVGALGGGLQVPRHGHSNVPLLTCLLQDLTVHGVFLADVVVAQVHNLAFFHIEDHPPGPAPLAQVVQGLLKLFSVFWSVSRLAQLGVVRKLFKNLNKAGGAVQVIDEDEEE